MEKTNSCLNSQAIIEYVASRAPQKVEELFEGLDEELSEIPNKREFLTDPNNWVSSAVLVKLYENAKRILNDENVAYKIGHKSVIEQRFGYIQKILIYAFGTPRKILAYAQKINDKFNRTKNIEIVKIEKGRAILRLYWRKNIKLSRDVCLYNQGIYSAIPTTWGGTLCKVTETKCYFKGDDYCEYHLSWKPQPLLKQKLFQLVAPWKIAKESVRELERDKKILQQKYEKIHALNKELQVKIDQLSALYETSTVILSTLDLKELLDKVLKRMMEIAKLDRAGVFLVDHEGKKLNLIHAAGVDAKTLSELKNYHIPVDKKNNIIARAARSKRPILVEDVNNISLNSENPLLRAFKPKAFVVVPLTVRGEVVGIMVGDNATDKNFIRDIDRDFLTSFANHIAMAIENANLYKRVETSEKKYRQIVENINEGILIMNESGEILFSNRKMNELMGTDNLVGTNIYDLVIEDDKKKLVALMMANYQGEQARQEVVFSAKDGNAAVPVMISSVPISHEQDGSFKGSLALITDLTHQKELERKLLQAQKLESIGTMAGGIAHDFNNILTGILGFTTLMKEKTKDRPDLGRFIDIIEKSSMRAADLVKKMLVFSRDASLQDDAVCSPVQVLEETFELMKSSFPKNIKIELRVLDDCPDIVCSPSQFQQILMNLCINSRDAMPGGGKITITLDTISYSELPFAIRQRTRGERFVRLSVSDDGCGIAPDVMERIFDPFFTTKEVGKGSGLGLAMVYGIMEGLGGGIDVRSKIGLGTTFDLYFPVSTKARKESDVHYDTSTSKGNETILVVDDEELLRELASEILKPYGYRIITAKNGREAVETYKAMFPEIHLVIMDVLMPEMDGIQAAKEIREFDSEARIIFCSGYTSRSEVSATGLFNEKDGSLVLIKKPFNPNELATVVRKALLHKGSEVLPLVD
ncbi:MAG: response regulator [Thermodesulfobacteria bacterium]|nr:response regulator [Thermodesulfobacteriota bacterium]